MNSLIPTNLYKTEETVMNKPAVSDGQLRFHRLEEIERNDQISGKTVERIKHFEFFWLKTGLGTLTADMKETPVSEDSIYCLAPGQYRKFRLHGASEGYYLSLSPEYVHLTESQIDFSLLIEQYKDERNLMTVPADGEMEELIIRIHRELGRQTFMRTELLKGLIKVFLLDLSRRIEDANSLNGNTANEGDLGFVRKFMQLVKKDFATKKLVADYADELCITPNYLNYLVKKQTGYPASHHIQQYIIMEAKRRAAYSGLRMKEIAHALGFEDYAHFSKFFKNYSGIKFSSFKKGMLGNNLGMI
jgi:AraC family transcriptional regulator, transcriptional activator of pobA